MPAHVDPTRCIGCENCLSVCPVKAIRMVAKKAVVDSSVCIDCSACIAECPVQAIKMTNNEKAP